jgi:hypothetical protein
MMTDCQYFLRLCELRIDVQCALEGAAGSGEVAIVLEEKDTCGC